MGIINHNIIVVTGSVADVKRAHAIALAEFDLVKVNRGLSPAHEQDWAKLVSPIIGEGICINDHSSFFVAPDGSKEGWGTSDSFDEARDNFHKALEQESRLPYDKRIYVDWFEVAFGEINDPPKVLRGSYSMEKEAEDT